MAEKRGDFVHGKLIITQSINVEDEDKEKLKIILKFLAWVNGWISNSIYQNEKNTRGKAGGLGHGS